MLDPRAAVVAYTPLSLVNRLQPTVGRLAVLPMAEVEGALDPAPAPGDHEIVARPPQSATFAEAVPVVPASEADPIRGAMLTAIRLVTLDGLDAAVVFSAFAANLAGWAEVVQDGRARHYQRLSAR